MENTSVWCTCGANLSKFPSVPTATADVKKWLARHVPEFLGQETTEAQSLIDRARAQVISAQDGDIAIETQKAADVARVRGLLAEFLSACSREYLDPTINIGQLRRDRWKQWKRIPAEYKEHSPLRTFKTTPGYIFEVKLAKFKDELCVGLDGALYKHQLNAPDPYPIEDLIDSAPVNKIAEGLIASLVWLLKAKQQPDDPQVETVEQVEAVDTETEKASSGKTGLRLSLRRRKPVLQGDEPADSAAAVQSAEIAHDTQADTETLGDPVRPTSPGAPATIKTAGE